MTPSVALVYDRVNTPYGGAEQVITALHEIFPEAPLFTSVYHSRAKWAQKFDVKTTFLQKLPLANKLHRFFVPLMPLAFESLDLSAYDIIISITSAEAKGVITKPNQLHLCYLLTPTRYLYSHRSLYEKTHWPFKIPLIGWLSRKIFDYLTWWDQVAAQRPDVIIPISHLIQERTEKHYQRQTAQVIYPPLDLKAISQANQEKELAAYRPYYLPSKYHLVISRLVSYKRLDLAIQACQQLNQALVVIGAGPQQTELEKMAGDKIYFLGQVSPLQKQAIINQAQSLLMPGLEDFGITALEAVVNNLPVILHHKSGAAEILQQLESAGSPANALYLKKLSLPAMVAALQNLPPRVVQPGLPQTNLQQYAINSFKKRFEKTVFKFWHEVGQTGK